MVVVILKICINQSILNHDVANLDYIKYEFL